MRIKRSQLATFISGVLASVKQGCETAQAAGLDVELPEFIDFKDVEVIEEVQSLSSVTTTAGTSSKTATGTKPEIVEATVRSGGKRTTDSLATEGGTTVNHRVQSDEVNTDFHSKDTDTTTRTPNLTETTTRGTTDTTHETASLPMVVQQTQSESGGNLTTTNHNYA